MSTEQDKERELLKKYHRIIDKMDKYERKIYSDEMAVLSERYPDSSALDLLLLCTFLSDFMSKLRQARFEKWTIVGAMTFLFLLIFISFGDWMCRC